MGLGCPLEPNKPVPSVLNGITKFQGEFVEGDRAERIQEIALSIHSNIIERQREREQEGNDIHEVSTPQLIDADTRAIIAGLTRERGELALKLSVLKQEVSKYRQSVGSE